jgi:hypothetical protein
MNDEAIGGRDDRFSMALMGGRVDRPWDVKS